MLCSARARPPAPFAAERPQRVSLSRHVRGGRPTAPHREATAQASPTISQASPNISGSEAVNSSKWLYHTVWAAFGMLRTTTPPLLEPQDTLLTDPHARVGANHDRPRRRFPRHIGSARQGGRRRRVEAFSSPGLHHGIGLRVEGTSSTQPLRTHPREPLSCVACRESPAITASGKGERGIDVHRQLGPQQGRGSREHGRAVGVSDTVDGPHRGEMPNGLDHGGRGSLDRQLWIPRGEPMPRQVESQHAVAAICEDRDYPPPALGRPHEAVKQDRRARAVAGLDRVQEHRISQSGSFPTRGRIALWDLRLPLRMSVAPDGLKP